MTEPTEEVYSVEEFALAVGVPCETVEAWKRNNQVPSASLTAEGKFIKSVIDPFIEWYKNNPTTDTSMRQEADRQLSFVAEFIAETQRVQAESGLKSPYSGQDIIYYTVARGIAFTSFDHPMMTSRQGNVPLMAFGEMVSDCNRKTFHTHSMPTTPWLTGNMPPSIFNECSRGSM